MWEGVFDSETEVIREQYTVVLTFEGGNFSPSVGTVNPCRSIRIVGLVSGKLVDIRVQAAITINPREGINQISTRRGHFLLGILFTI